MSRGGGPAGRTQSRRHNRIEFTDYKPNTGYLPDFHQPYVCSRIVWYHAAETVVDGVPTLPDPVRVGTLYGIDPRDRDKVPMGYFYVDAEGNAATYDSLAFARLDLACNEGKAL